MTKEELIKYNEETIECLRNSIEVSSDDREILIWLLQKEIIENKLHLNQESYKYKNLNGLIERLRM